MSDDPQNPRPASPFGQPSGPFPPAEQVDPNLARRAEAERQRDIEAEALAAAIMSGEEPTFEQPPIDPNVRVNHDGNGDGWFKGHTERNPEHERDTARNPVDHASDATTPPRLTR